MSLVTLETAPGALRPPQTPLPPLRALALVDSPVLVYRVAKILIVLFALTVLAMMFVPWQQTAAGTGRVVAFAPLDRQQNVTAPVAGRVVQWWVHEGSKVNKGDKICEIVDNDPDFVIRLQQQRDAAAAKLSAAQAKVESYASQISSLEETRRLSMDAAREKVNSATNKVLEASQNLLAAEAQFLTAELNFERRRKLKEDGLVSQRDFELAELEFNQKQADVERSKAVLEGAKADLASREAELGYAGTDAQSKIDSARAQRQTAQGEVAEAEASLQKTEVDIARQQQQMVLAPRDGNIFRILVNNEGEFVKAGDPVALLVPDTEDRAVEIWVTGNDAPLISEGRHVRLQFEGWPAVQFSGWPSVAIGTFGGTVKLIDAADDGKGRFRILVVPDDINTWPSPHYLRQGVRANGWVLLGQVRLGYEIWRQLNGFPPVISKDEPDLKGDKPKETPPLKRVKE